MMGRELQHTDDNYHDDRREIEYSYYDGNGNRWRVYSQDGQSCVKPPYLPQNSSNFRGRPHITSYIPRPRKRTSSAINTNTQPISRCSTSNIFQRVRSGENTRNQPVQKPQAAGPSSSVEKNQQTAFRKNQVVPTTNAVSNRKKNSSFSVQDAAVNQLKRSSRKFRDASEIEPDDEPKFIELVRERAYLYNQRDPSFKNLKKKRESWITIGKMFNTTDGDCEKKWQSLRARYRRYMKQYLADEDSVTNEIKRFLESMSFLKYQMKTGANRKNISKNCGKLPQSALLEQNKGASTSQSVFGPTSSISRQRSENSAHTTPHSDAQSPAQENTSAGDKSTENCKAIGEDVASELQRYPPRTRNLIKAQIYNVIAGNST